MEDQAQEERESELQANERQEELDQEANTEEE